MSDFGEDLRKLIQAGEDLGKLVDKVDEAATSAIGQVGKMLDQVSPERLDRAVDAGAQAALAAGLSAAAAAFGGPPSLEPDARPAVPATPAPRRVAPPPAAPAPIETGGSGNLYTPCDKHGILPWEKKVMCRNCRRVFTLNDSSSSRPAPERCPCGSQLLPEKGATRPQPFTAIPACKMCFALACATGGRIP